VETQVARGRLEIVSGHGQAGRRRDEAARQRDALAHERDGGALALDGEALTAILGDENLDLSDPRVQALQSWMASLIERAANDREQARRDRELAALDRAQAARERRAAGTDDLTGARRRGVGLEELDREVERARRTDTSLVAVFVDVDNLKSVNDELGHSAGDQLLCDVVSGLRRRLRSYDLVIRLGGDEFLCALPGVSLEHARARFADLNIELEMAGVHGSVSCGCSELHDHETRPQLIDRADHELLTDRAMRRRTRPRLPTS
jgi:diguanylate cyclase (GGDEF)-like protein